MLAGLEKSVLGLFQSPYFPLAPDDIQANVTFTELDSGSVNVGSDYKVYANPHPHPNGALSFMIEMGDKRIAFITDIEHTKGDLVQSVVDMSKNADILIHDSHFTPADLPEHKTWGHSSWEECTAVAKMAGVKQLYLFHFSPNYSDKQVDAMTKEAQADFPHTAAAYQGLEVEL